MPSNEGNCRTCSAPVIWAVSPAGKNLPLDAKLLTAGDPALLQPAPGAKRLPTYYRIQPEGDHRNPRNLAYVISPAEMVGERKGERVYVSHFATCPQAAQHSRGR